MDNLEYRNWLKTLEQFLIKHNATSFWSHVHQDKLRTMSHPSYWIIHGFRWTHTDEGYAYWDRINNLWDEITNK
jgi:hypothetical protein